MDAALAQVKRLADTVSPLNRPGVILDLMKVVHSLETPEDMLQRVGAMSLQTTAVVIGLDLKLFNILAEAENPLTLDKLAQNTGAERALLGKYQAKDPQVLEAFNQGEPFNPSVLARLLRYLRSIGMVDEVSTNTFIANRATRHLTTKVSQAGIRHYFYTCHPAYHALPAYLKKTEYKNPADATYTSWHVGHNTEKSPFVWFADKPKHMTYFNDFMATRRRPELSWLSVYPVEQEVSGWPDEKAVYIDIGGNIGHQCAEFKETYPDVPGRVILQDMAHSIAAALPTPGVEKMVHNFFEPQPIKGAKFYFMRGVLHDHPDHKVEQIIKHIRDAMTEESVLLVDEILLPEFGVNLEASAHDMTMLAACAGAERSEVQWIETFGKLGLRLVKTYLYNAPSYESVMDVRLV